MDLQQLATELFLECCEMAPVGREAFLEERCGGDRELSASVRGMLAIDERRPGFLAGKATDVLRAREEELPLTIGGFRIRSKLGEGGMGTVYLAEQLAPRRTVALKTLRSTFFSAGALRRFEHEGEFLGRLQHPGIAQVFEVGRAETENGPIPYLAIELVHGEPLTDYARNNELSVRKRIELVACVADAVHHAHQNSVIHRDLKPANILVDESGQPKVLDFGIARASGADVQLTTLETNVGQILGTLAYMSPEQASGDPEAIDTRTDVYSLGVLLYELLADKLPYDVSNTPLHEALRIIQEEEPGRLSTIRSLYKGDLATIVGKALEKDRSHRYASASDLAAELRRFLRDEPIAARPPSAIYSVRKFVRRNRALAIGAGVGFLSLALGFVVSTVLLFMNKAALSEARWEAYRGNVLAAGAELVNDNYWGAREHLTDCTEEHRGWEWDHATFALDSWLEKFEGHHGSVTALSISRDGTHLVSGSADEVRLWDLRDGVSIPSLALEAGGGRITSVDVGPLGRFVIFSRADSIYVWEPHSASPPLELSEPGMLSVRTLRFGPDATWFANGSKSGVVRIWDLKTGEVRAQLEGHKGLIRGLAVSPDGETIASGSEGDSMLRLWDVRQGRMIQEFEVYVGVKSVAFSPDGRLLAVGDKLPSISIWEVETGAKLRTWPCTGTYVTSVAFSGDGSRLVSGHWDGAARTWDVHTGSKLWSHRGHSRTWGEGVSVAAHPDGRRFITSGYDYTPRLWSFEAKGASTVVADFPDLKLRPRDLRFTPDGARIMAEAGELRLWSAEDGRPLPSLEGLGAALSTDGERLATARPGKIVDASTGRELGRFSLQVESLAFSHDGRWLVVGDSEEATLHVLDGTTAEVARSFPGDSGPPLLLCVGLGGAVFSASDRTIDLWDLEQGHLGTLTGHEQPVLALAVISGGDFLASGSSDGWIYIWDTTTRQRVREFRGSPRGVDSLSANADGDRLASGSSDGLVRIWGVARGDVLATLRPGSDTERNFYNPVSVLVAFSPDGERLLTSMTGTIRVWESKRETARNWSKGATRWKGDR